MSGTQIASWQLTSDAGTTVPPFHYTIIGEISKAILEETKWVDDPDVLDVEYWKRYRAKVSKAIETNFFNWGESPDENFNDLWTFKYNSLIELYSTLHTLNIKHSHDPYLSDVYREKSDQAIDWLSADNADEQDFPFIVIDMDIFNIGPEEAAVNILKKRSSWMYKMAHIESVRIPTKLKILNATCKKIVVDILATSITELQAFDNTWT